MDQAWMDDDLLTPSPLHTSAGTLVFFDETPTIRLSDIRSFFQSEEVYWAMDRSEIDWAILLQESRFLTARIYPKDIALPAACGELVGTTRVRSDFVYEAKLNDVVTARRLSGLGIATTLCRWALRHPWTGDASRFLLETHNAEGLYRKLGFTTAAEQDTIHMRVKVEDLRKHGLRP